MPNEVEPLSRKVFAGFITVGILLIISFIATYLSMESYIMDHGGVDVYIAVAPICISAYILVISLYVSIFVASYARSQRSLSGIWAVVGFALTVGAIIIFAFFFHSPLFAVLAPILSTFVTISLIRVMKKSIQ